MNYVSIHEQWIIIELWQDWRDDSAVMCFLVLQSIQVQVPVPNCRGSHILFWPLQESTHTNLFFSFCWNIFNTIRKHNKALGSHFELVRATSSGGDRLYFESWVSDKCHPENTSIIVQRHSQDSASSKACGRAPSLLFPTCGCCCYSVVIPSFIAAWLQSVFVITWHSPCVTNFIWLSFCKNINLFKLGVHSTPVWLHIV